MIDVLIVGSVALDDVRTPFGEVHAALGGSAVYAALAANYLSSVGIVGVVGADFPEKYVRLLTERDIGVEGLEHAAGDTFRWKGYYDYDLGTAHTLETCLNVFADFAPKIPAAYQSAPFLFLANIDPVLQAEVLRQVHKPRLVILDTMNYWITHQREALLEVLARADVVMVNESEARQLTGTPHVLQAARWIRRHGPRGVVIKKGEHGALVFWGDQLFVVPAFPLETIKDPTGAGDTFAGGFIGTLAKLGDLSEQTLRVAASTAATLASFAVEDFSVHRLASLDGGEIRDRYQRLRSLALIDPFPGIALRSSGRPGPER